MTRIELFKEMYELSCYNLHCYSQDYLMSKPKEKYIKEWNKEKEKVELLEKLIAEEEEKKTNDIKENKNEMENEETEELE